MRRSFWRYGSDGSLLLIGDETPVYDVDPLLSETDEDDDNDVPDCEKSRDSLTDDDGTDEDSDDESIDEDPIFEPNGLRIFAARS